jgi:hypothetical protein
MDPAGSTWAVSGSPFDLALCDLKEQRQPSGLIGWVSSLAFSGTSPLVAVVPFGDVGPDVAMGFSPRPPRVFRLEGSRWEAISWAPLPEINDRSKTWTSQLKAETDALICSGPKSIWLASWSAYRVQEVSAFEKPKRELLVGSGKVEWVSFTAQERARNDADLRRRGLDPRTNQGGKVYPQNVIRAIVCGRDGLIYLFVTTGERLALDRFDPTQQVLERVMLDGVKVSGGPMTAVMANDELIFGGRFVEDGLWRISLEDLATARWKPVLGARIDGKPMP